MNTISKTENIDRNRRRLLGAASMGVVAAGAASLLPPRLARADTNEAIHPFKVHIPDEQLVDLRRRIAATRWPDKETDQSQGAQLAKLQALVRYWGSDYDWRKVEARLNALPQFLTEIDGVDIHFIHVRSKHANALPLIVTHGWPGSIIEQLKIIDPLTDPTVHGGGVEDAFDVVIPSLPGYGFPGHPTDTGWDPDRIARAWAVLMQRLGYSRYVAQGGDWGTPISSAMAWQKAAGLLGIHINLPATVPPEIAAALGGGPLPAGISDKERAVVEALMKSNKAGNLAYFTMMTARPQTVAARLYWEGGKNGSVVVAAAQKTNEIDLPVAITVFPDDVYRPPETWARRAYRNLIYFHEVDKGGHFAAWEQPELFSAELRAAFRPLRQS